MKPLASVSTNLTTQGWHDTISTARRCASAVCALCVRPSVRHKPVLYRNDWTNRAGFWQEGFLSPHCVIRKFGYLRKLGYFPPGTLSHTPDLANFAAATRSRCQQNSYDDSGQVVHTQLPRRLHSSLVYRVVKLGTCTF